HRRAGRQAGDGRQGCAVPEVRRHRCVRHRTRHRDHRRCGGAQRHGDHRQEDRGSEAGDHGHGRGRHFLREHAGTAGPEAGKHPGLRPRGRDPHRPYRADGPGQGALRAEDRCPQAGRGDRRRRRVPGPVGRRRAEAGDGQDDGAGPGDLRAGQPDPGNHAGAGPRRARRRDHGHRPFGLPEPGQQCAGLPVYFPWCAGCSRHHDQ
uniref:UMP kinase n=1 Tax=Parastrongyloides trichosuri TaxID=131310 RepID=A0A0N4ZJD9_PARTI